MLKICEDVDLKELEKFGFEFEEMYDAYVKYIFTGFHTIKISVNVSNHHFEKNEIHCSSNSAIDCIFTEERIKMLCEDLIQAGLVEKI